MYLNSKQIKIAKKIADSYKVALNISFNYQVPNNIFTCIYDFYALNFLRNGIDEGDYRELMQSNKFQGYQNPKEIEAQINVNQAYNKLCNYLEKQFMNLIYYQVARQFSHLRWFYNYLDSVEQTTVLNHFNQREKNFIQAYLQECEKLGILGSGESSFQEGKKVINALHPNRKFFIELAEKVFESIINYGGYGGKNWVDICEAYLMFFKSSTEIAIDHVFDLQHNTGSIFYKHPKYNELAQDIKEILDNKRNAKYPMVYISHCSHSIQDACRYLMRTDYGIYQDQFKQVEKTRGQLIESLIESLKDKYITDEQMDNILRKIEIEDGFWNMQMQILNRNIRNRRVINRFYLFICNKTIDSEYGKIIKELIENDIITDEKMIAKGMNFLILHDGLYIICEFIYKGKIKNKDTIYNIVLLMKKYDKIGCLLSLAKYISDENLIDDIVRFAVDNDINVVMGRFYECNEQIENKIIDVFIEKKKFKQIQFLIEQGLITDPLVMKKIERA